jgi:hypothetical protein
MKKVIGVIIMLVFVLTMIIAVIILIISGLSSILKGAQCPEYSLPAYLEPRTDGDCAAIGILLRKATAGRKCVYVTNDWWQGANPVHHELAIDLAKGY